MRRPAIRGGDKNNATSTHTDFFDTSCLLGELLGAMSRDLLAHKWFNEDATDFEAYG